MPRILPASQQTALETAGRDLSVIIRVDWESPIGTKYYTTRSDIPVTGITFEDDLESNPYISHGAHLGIQPNMQYNSMQFTIPNLTENTDNIEEALAATIVHGNGAEVTVYYLLVGAAVFTPAISDLVV